MRWNPWSRRRTPNMDEHDVRDELASHVALRIDENLSRGLAPDDARREAERRFGPLQSIARQSTRIRRRQASTRRAMLVDLRHAAAAAVRAPLASIVGALVMAIGLGTVAAAWFLASALLHTPPAGVANPGELQSALEALDIPDGPALRLISYRAFRAIASAAPGARPFAWGQRELQVVHASTGRVIPGTFVTGRYFEALGVRPHAGRLLIPADARENPQVCVVSLRLARALAADPRTLVGGSLTVNGQPFDVVGVAPARFQGLEAGRPADLWLPMEAEPSVSTVFVLPDGRRLRGYVEANMGWLRGGVRIPAAMPAADVAGRMSAAAKAAAPTEELRALTSVVLTDRIWLSPWPVHRARLDAVLTPLRIAAGLTLILTSACLGSLFLGRVSDRRQEFATRLALGAGHVRIVRLAGFEMMLISLAGACLAWFTARAFLLGAGALILADGVTVADAAAFLASRAVVDFIGIAGLAAMLATAGPLIYVARACRAAGIGSARATAPGVGFRRVLVAAQVAGGCAMLAGAGMLTQSLFLLRAQPLGFDARGVGFVELNPSGAGLTDDEIGSLVRRFLDSTGAGEAVALSDELPFGGTSTVFVAAEGSALQRESPVPVTRLAGPYFETLGISLVAGRTFDRGDGPRAVAILSAPLAEGMWPGQNAIGRVVRIGGARGTPHEVIGVVAGVRDGALRARPSARIYLPLGADFGTLVVLARDERPRAGSAGLVERTRQLDARLVALQAGPVDRLVAQSLGQRRALQIVSATIGAGSLLMVGVGVWGLSRTTLRRRWREFGIRLALGSTPGEVGRLALRDAWIVAGAGGAGGLLAAWQFGRVLQGWLFGVTPHDPGVLAAATAVVIAAVLAGGLGPARQAARADPSALLRE